MRMMASYVCSFEKYMMLYRYLEIILSFLIFFLNICISPYISRPQLHILYFVQSQRNKIARTEMPSTKTAPNSGLKAFITSRATDLCNQVIDSSAVALCAADEIMWRYLESSRNPYAKLLHKGLTAGPIGSQAAAKITTAEAFDELQAGLAVVADEELEGRLVRAYGDLSDDIDVNLGPLGRLLASASVAAAIGVDETIRALSATRIGAVLGLPRLGTVDAAACTEWNELHHELSNVPEEDEEVVCVSSSSSSTSSLNLALMRRHLSLVPVVDAASSALKRVVVAAPVSDALVVSVVNASTYLPLVGGKTEPRQQSAEALAWGELQSHFSY